MPRTWTTNQERAIAAQAADVCVSAGAGSGKTGVLVERFVRTVREGRASVGEILVITFTEKATREMKARIVDALTEAGLRDERRQVETAYISTIHGFCSRLLQENPFEAGIDPAFTVLDEVEARRLFRDSVDAAVAAGYAAGDEDVVELVAAAQDERVFGVDGGDPLASLSAAVEGVLARVRGAGWRQDQVLAHWQAGGDGSARASKAPVVALLRSVHEELSACLAAMRELRAGAMGAVEVSRRELAESIAGLRPPDGDSAWDAIVAALEALRQLGQHAGRAARGRSTGATGEVDLQGLFGRIGDAVERARELHGLVAAREHEAERHCHRLWGLLAAAWARYDQAKREQGVLDNDDLQAEAVRLLETSPGVARRYRRRFRYLMVDEFQDTSPLQMRLVELLHPREDPGNALFIVGDSQQAIYGFRDADPSIFRDVERRLREAGGGQHVDMADNFRSRPEIVGLVNYLFGQTWARSGTRFVPLVHAARHLAKPDPTVELMLAADPGRALYASLEGAALAARIREIVEGEQLRITDQDHPRFGHPVRYGDVAVLLRALTRIEDYERAFAAAGVPYFVVGGGRGYYARYEVRDVMSFLTVVDTPLDDVALAAALRSPMVGADTDTLYRLALAAREAGRGSPLYPAIPALLEAGTLPAGEAAALRAFHGTVEELRACADRLPVGLLLERMIEATHYDARLLARPNGRRRVANLRKLLQMACAAQSHGLSAFIQRLRQIEKLSDREGDAPTEEEASDVVRFLTVHKAKGLEFPVVFVADMGRGLAPSDRSLFLCDPRTLALGCRLGSYQTAAHRAIAAARHQAELEEADRLLYVALTRAREHLVLCGSTSARPRGPNWADAAFRQLGVLGPPADPLVQQCPGGIEVRLAPMAGGAAS